MDKDEFLKNQIRNLNQHLPKGRTPLSKLLKQKKPQIETRDGSKHRFKKKELEFLADMLPKEKHSKLRLPIIMRLSPGKGRGTAEISGTVEKEVFRKILDKEKDDEDRFYIYRPEIREIRRKLPTTTQYAFLISSRRENNSERMG